jgi:hypothetical protein
MKDPGSAVAVSSRLHLGGCLGISVERGLEVSSLEEGGAGIEQTSVGEFGEPNRPRSIDGPTKMLQRSLVSALQPGHKTKGGL